MALRTRNGGSQTPDYWLKLARNTQKGDPEHGIAPGTAFEDLPDDWVCPMCGIDKSMFQRCIDNYN